MLDSYWIFATQMTSAVSENVGVVISRAKPTIFDRPIVRLRGSRFPLFYPN